MRRRISRSLIASAMVGAMVGGVSPVTNSAIGVTSSGGDTNVSAKSTTGTKATNSKQQTKANRLTSSRMSGYSWLKPVNKESFKQARRKQLAKRSFKKAKKNKQT